MKDGARPGPLIPEAMVVVIMGVTGAGKTTIGRLLAEEVGWRFYDADDFHPPANVEKMRRGEPLNDLDRLGWLQDLNRLVSELLQKGQSAVLACSALKAAYRKYLLIDDRVRLVYLRGDEALVRQRLAERRGHYMNPSLVDSQFATLEEPSEGIAVDIEPDPHDIVRNIRLNLGT